MEKRLTTPFTKDKIKDLKAGRQRAYNRNNIHSA